MALVRKLVTLVCFAAILLAAASPHVHGQVSALVVTVFLSLGALAVALKHFERHSSQVPTFPQLSFATPRAPPQA